MNARGEAESSVVKPGGAVHGGSVCRRREHEMGFRTVLNMGVSYDVGHGYEERDGCLPTEAHIAAHLGSEPVDASYHRGAVSVAQLQAEPVRVLGERQNWQGHIEMQPADVVSKVVAQRHGQPMPDKGASGRSWYRATLLRFAEC